MIIKDDHYDNSAQLTELKVARGFCSSMRKTSSKLRTDAHQFISKVYDALLSLSMKHDAVCLLKLRKILSELDESATSNATFMSRGFLLRFLIRICYLHSATTSSDADNISYEAYWNACLADMKYIQKFPNDIKELYSYTCAKDYFKENGLVFEIEKMK